MRGRLALWYHVYSSLWTAKNIQTKLIILLLHVQILSVREAGLTPREPSISYDVNGCTYFKILILWESHRVIILNRGSMPCKRMGRKWCNSSRPQTLETARSLATGPSMYSAFLGNCSVSYLSFVYGRSLWSEHNGGEKSHHWKANRLPLFSILTLWREPDKILYHIMY